MTTLRVVAGLAVFLASTAQAAAELVIVRAGQPVATVVVADAPTTRKAETPSDRMAARVLVEWVEKMTGAELPIASTAPAQGPCILIGAAARQAGLKLDGIDSPSREGLRVVVDSERVLLAGQNDTATVRAVCRLLEHWGCRYYIDHPLGEVFPQTRELTLGRLDLREKPGFLHRRIWGSQWSGENLWKIWNGAGGETFDTRHAWGQYVDRKLFDKHPEYFRERDGRREPSDWYCTSNPGLREVFARGVIAEIERGNQNPSISPPDGRGYCECAACRAQDDPQSREPSSGTVSVTNRYCDFYADVARRVAEKHPEALLSFYCYADYTQAPTSGIRLPENLVAWIAPIRYCRYHAIGQADCPSRTQLAELVAGWSRAAARIGYRTYNYNLAEVLAPVPLLAVWRHDVPYLQEHGAIGINFETLPNWQIYAPHIYLSIRLAYDPQADAERVLDDFFARFYGPAAEAMKQYWLGIDRAVASLTSHAGSFYALPLVYTPEFLKACRRHIAQARGAVMGQPAYAARVEMAAQGFQNAEEYADLGDAMNRGDFAQAQRTYDKLLARSLGNVESRQASHYTVTYLERFLGPQVEAGLRALSRPRRLVAVLPDRWRLEYDDGGQGESRGYHQTDFDDSAWREVATYSSPLDAQGLPDRQTILWYRVAIDVPRELRQPALHFVEVDGSAAVFVDGQRQGGSEKKRESFTVDLGDRLPAGQHLVAVRVDHSTITELFLGGLIRPVLLTSQ